MVKNRMTKEDSEAIIRAAHQTWQYIAYDMHQLCAEHGDSLTEAAARECIIDADRTPVISKFLEEEKYTFTQVENVLKKVKFL